MHIRQMAPRYEASCGRQAEEGRLGDQQHRLTYQVLSDMLRLTLAYKSGQGVTDLPKLIGPSCNLGPQINHLGYIPFKIQ